ncbi:hypothetical protein [Streptomyces hokutonensis]|uniref:hypothetical protein n=1 Tax=Streptomyces hokutonensis TaxID=1306990 RepID=UPI00036563D2|nr:hypothetical protein [Streptomyces hokutonensis]
MPSVDQLVQARRLPPGDARARAAVPKVEVRSGGDLWALRPAAGKLDSIAG